jgi:hypothetical protein
MVLQAAGISRIVTRHKCTNESVARSIARRQIDYVVITDDAGSNARVQALLDSSPDRLILLSTALADRDRRKKARHTYTQGTAVPVTDSSADVQSATGAVPGPSAASAAQPADGPSDA